MAGATSLGLISIEVAVFCLGILILALDMISGGRRPGICRWTALTGISIILVLSLFTDRSGTGWHGMVEIDAVTRFFERFFLAAAVLVFIMMGRSRELGGRDPAEYYALAVFATLGMMFMAASRNLMVLFMALELLTLSFYVLVAYNRRRAHGLEAGVKYLIVGAVSAAFMLLGIAFIYGATGTLDYAEIAGKVAGAGQLDPVLIPGVVLLVTGLGFKVSAVPFHSWAPDVYEGAPTPVVAYLSVGSKAAGFVLLQRLVFSVFLPTRPEWVFILALVAVASLFYGNLGALPQTNLKRLIGYSGIAQAGYLTLGLVAGNVDGGAAMLYFLAGYLFTNLLAFLVIVVASRAAERHEIADYSGIARRSPVLAASLLVAMLSLAGVPPMAGFFGKFLLIDAVIRAGYWWLAVIAAVNVAIALYYYISVVKVAYVEKPADDEPLIVPASLKAVMYVCMAAILFLGIFQGPLYEAARTAVGALF